MAEGIQIRLTHTGVSASNILVDDIRRATAGGRRGMPDEYVYLPAPTATTPNPSIIVTFGGLVPMSYERGDIRGYIDVGHLTATFIIGGQVQDASDGPVILTAVAGGVSPDKYTGTRDDSLFLINTTADRYQVTLPPGDTHLRQRVRVMDMMGTAVTNPITVVAAAGETINGNVTHTISHAYGRIELAWNQIAQDWFIPSLTIGGIGSFANPVFGDYLTSGLVLQTRGANPPSLKTFRDGLVLFAFIGTGATTKEAYFSVHILHDLKAGSTPSFHVHWAHIIEAPAGDIKWNIEMSYSQGYLAGSFGPSVVLSSVQTVGQQYEHHLTDDDDMLLPPAIASLLEPDGVLLCRVFRDPDDAADTFEDDAFLINIDMHYELGQVGTLERNRPYTSAGF